MRKPRIRLVILLGTLFVMLFIAVSLQLSRNGLPDLDRLPPEAPPPTSSGMHKRAEIKSVSDCTAPVLVSLTEWAGNQNLQLVGEDGSGRVASFAIAGGQYFVETFYQFREYPGETELSLGLVPRRGLHQPDRDLQLLWADLQLDSLWSELKIRAECDRLGSCQQFRCCPGRDDRCKSAQGCFCDLFCRTAGDCCPDFGTVCLFDEAVQF